MYFLQQIWVNVLIHHFSRITRHALSSLLPKAGCNPISRKSCSFFRNSCVTYTFYDVRNPTAHSRVKDINHEATVPSTFFYDAFLRCILVVISQILSPVSLSLSGIKHNSIPHTPGIRIARLFPIWNLLLVKSFEHKCCPGQFCDHTWCSHKV